MFCGSPERPAEKSLQIKEDDKFFSRLLSKESSAANPSLRVYYGGVSGAVPFMWESQPGTPKNTLSDTDDLVPPLTPPPSYFSNSEKKPSKEPPKSSLLHALLPKIMSLKKTVVSPSSSSSSLSSPRSSSDSSIFSAHVPTLKFRGSWKQFVSRSFSFDSREDDEEEGTVGSPTSTLCFGMIGRVASVGRFRGRCYRV